MTKYQQDNGENRPVNIYLQDMCQMTKSLNNTVHDVAKQMIG